MYRLICLRSSSSVAAAFVLAIVTGASAAAPWVAYDEEVLVTDWDQHQVLRYDAATGAAIDEFVPRKSGGLNDPVGVVFGPHDGNLYVASGQFAGNGQVKGVLCYEGATGVFLGEFTEPGFLSSPRGIIFGPGGHLYVADFSADHNAGRVVRFDGLTGAFLDDFVPPGYGGLSRPVAILFGPDANGDGCLDLYLQSTLTSSILHYDGTTGLFLGEFVPPGVGGLDHPTGMVFGPDGHLYVANWAVGVGHLAVLRFQGPGGVMPGEPMPSPGNGAADFVAPGTGGLLSPNGLLFGPDGNDDGYPDLYVTNGEVNGSYKTKVGTGTVKRYDGLTGEFIDTFITAGSGGLRGPFYLTFRQTDPVTLDYLGD